MIKRQLFQLINWREIKPYLLFSFIWIMFSYPFFFQGKIPAPLDFLVNFYSPWEQYYDFPVKNPGLSDVVSQIIPWKIFSGQELRAGRIPLWNQYNLAGAPHLGNWQSGVLYPTTLLFLIFPDYIAWSLHVLLQPLLAGIFMILFLRSLKLSNAASLIGAVAFAYGGFMTTWLEWGTLGHALLWLPLTMACVEKRKDLILTLALTSSWLAGHPQMTLYVVMVTSAYWLYRRWSGFNKFRLLIVILLNCYIVPLLVAAPQILPAAQVYFSSARTLVDGTSWAKAFLIPVSGLVTFLAPDFFGNPVTRNSWSNFSYVEMQGYVGIVTIALALLSAIGIKRPGLAKARPGLIKFLIGMIATALVLATNNSVSNWIIDLKLPIISSSSPARLIGVIDFGLAALGAIGFESLRKLLREGKVRELVKPVLAIAIIFGAMWLGDNPVSRRNLILPSLLMLAIIMLVIIDFYLRSKSQKFSSLFLISYFLFLNLLKNFIIFLSFQNYEYIRPFGKVGDDRLGF